MMEKEEDPLTMWKEGREVEEGDFMMVVGVVVVEEGSVKGKEEEGREVEEILEVEEKEVEEGDSLTTEKEANVDSSMKEKEEEGKDNSVISLPRPEKRNGVDRKAMTIGDGETRRMTISGKETTQKKGKMTKGGDGENS